jgi:hypothetical protein
LDQSCEAGEVLKSARLLRIGEVLESARQPDFYYHCFKINTVTFNDQKKLCHNDIFYRLGEKIDA